MWIYLLEKIHIGPISLLASKSRNNIKLCQLLKIEAEWVIAVILHHTSMVDVIYYSKNTSKQSMGVKLLQYFIRPDSLKI